MLNKICLLSFTAFQCMAASACELDDITAALQPGIIYSYQQEKQMTGLDRVLRSSGTLQLEQEELWMRQESPLRSDTLFSADGMTQFSEDGEALLQVNEPLVARLSSVFLAVYQGQLPELEETFSHELECQSADEGNAVPWTLELLPKNDELKNILDYIEVSGSTGIESIHFREARGDMTTIRITGMNGSVSGSRP